jgi:DNA-binding transcriptional regulator YdaS (Cro superfamily)
MRRMEKPMTRRLAPALAALVLAVAAPAVAQDAPGVGVAAARAWLIDKGGQVAEPTTDGGVSRLRVADALPWTLSFYGCQATCAEAQFTSTFTGPAVTLDWVNAWNRDNRYLKAHFAPASQPGGEASAVVNYDVVLTGAGPDQLAQPTGTWKQLQAGFAEALQRASAQ